MLAMSYLWLFFQWFMTFSAMLTALVVYERYFRRM